MQPTTKAIAMKSPRSLANSIMCQVVFNRPRTWLAAMIWLMLMVYGVATLVGIILVH